MSKNDRVPALRAQIAYVLSDAYNDSDEEHGPDALDYRTADRILQLLPDPHGYTAGARIGLIILTTVLTTAALTLFL